MAYTFFFKQHLRFNLLSQSFWTICTFFTHPCMAQRVWIHQSWHARILHVLHVVYAAQKHVTLYIGQKNCRDISQVIGRGSASALRCMCMWGCLMGMHVCAENVSRIIGGEVTSPLLCSPSLTFSVWFVYSEDGNTHFTSKVRTFLGGRRLFVAFGLLFYLHLMREKGQEYTFCHWVLKLTNVQVYILYTCYIVRTRVRKF